ncbi:hypothetical protein TCON_0065 [Astathelohania contejeani]|uniref:Uncharacterized protein n=1 Tax=Astathelohania contejeani TaxID=164912 RepID=A0ABQ7I2S1_9MICR|nr:hypothetical protein TCON_0065 [Thelohania contejeani]
MFYKILELITHEDGFQLFTEDLIRITEDIPNIKSLTEFKHRLFETFVRKAKQYHEETIHYWESVKIIKFINKIFTEIDDYEIEREFDFTDDIIKIYSKSLEEYVDGIPLIDEYVKYVLF